MSELRQRLFFALIGMLLLMVGCVPVTQTNLQPASINLTTCGDLDFQWKHVYNPDRLEVKQDCISLTGTIEKIIKEKDGDAHIRLKLDLEYSNLINQKNIDAQNGSLVVEPVCLYSITQESALGICNGWHNEIILPPVGTHVIAHGSYVLDKQHGWMEIHPLTSIRVIQ